MSAASEIHPHDPQTLYRHWEESQWSPGASAEELRGFALDGLTRRLNIIGVPINTL